MPARTGDSVCSRVLPMVPRPSARSVPRWRSLWPILLRIWVIFTLATLRVVLLLADRAALRLRLLLGDRLGRRLRLDRGRRSRLLGDGLLGDGLLGDGLLG